jgi:hypothetical protein
MILTKLKNIAAVDIVVLVFSLQALYLCFFTNYTLATLYATTAALFFCGVGFIVAAIDRNKPITITTNETTLITTSKATIQE